MSTLVGVLGALLSLPWVIAFGVFRSAYSRSDRLRVGALGLVFGVCFAAAVGSLITPAWRRAAVAALGVVCVLYAVPIAGSLVGRFRASRPRPQASP